MNWHTICVYYHDEDKNALILDGVRPLFDLLAGHVDAVSWTRHWRQGPHLRLNVRADDATVHRTVLPMAEEIVGGWLSEHPSTLDLDPDELLPLHQGLAEQERERGPLMPWHANNSLHLAPYDRRTEVLGNDEMADLLADFYADATPASFQMVERAATGQQRLMLAFDLIVATTHALTTGGVREGVVALRSHAEAFLNGHPESGRLRPSWDQHHRRHAEMLAARVAAVVATVDGDREAVEFVRDWANLLLRYRTRAEELMARQRFYMPPIGFGPESGLVRASPFHRALVAGPRWSGLGSSTTFALYRLLVNYTYLQLTRLGVAPAERFLLCHLAANAVEDQYGVSALDLVASTPAPNKE